jgi:isoquinoline 1-oxidoreductase subunit beta
VQGNFHDFPLLRLTQAPPVEVHFRVLTDNRRPASASRRCRPCAGLCNAIFAATGKRIRSLPLSKHARRSVDDLHGESATTTSASRRR